MDFLLTPYLDDPTLHAFVHVHHHTQPLLARCNMNVFSKHGIVEGMESTPPDTILKSTHCLLAAGFGHLDALKWLRVHGCPWTIEANSAAASNGHLEVVQWLVAQNPSQIAVHGPLMEAVRNGDLEMVGWLAPRTVLKSTYCLTAAQTGQLETLKWLRAQDPPCPWDHGSMKNGHVETLRWLRDQDPPCPWDV
jgi:hypothetical protein